MNVFKKIVAGASIFAVAVVSTASGVSAYTNAQLDAANGLAGMGIIVDHSNDPMAYNLDQTVLRQEIAAVARGVYEVDNSMAVNSAKTDTCSNAFADVSATNPNLWACYTVEGLLNNDLIAANATFRPEENITKSEALGMVVKAACGNDYSYDASAAGTWQAQLGMYASANGIATFSDYTTAATRGFTFEAAVNAMNACSDSTDDTDSLLEDLLNDLGGTDTTTDTDTDTSTDTDTDTTTDTDTDTDTSTTTPVTGGSVEVMLSADTPAGVTIPAGVNGLPVASFDFTAGDSDVTISQVTVKRTGLSDADTLNSIAAFTELGRASNEKNDSQENSTEAQLNLSGGGVVVQAGQTRTITFVVDIPTLAAEPSVESDEFALELVEVQASASVTVAGGLTSNTMRIGSVDAPEITIETGGSVSDPQLGEMGADIFEFEVEGANDEDVILKSITFEADGDAEDNLANFELYFNGDLVATTPYANDDYLTFNLGNGVLIEEGRNEDFTVKADVVAGAGEDIGFNIDGSLDVTAESTTFGYGAAVDISAVTSNNAFGQITIEAGELTIIENNLDYDEIREDKDGVVVASFTVVNASGENLELQDFGVRFDIDAGTSGITDSADIFELVEIYGEGVGTYSLDVDGTDDLDVVYSDNIDVILPLGESMWEIRVDTTDNNITNFDSISFDASFTTDSVSSTTGGFYVEETDDDTQVTDINPSTLSFDTIDGSISGIELSVNPLADLDVVSGANGIEAMEFTVEADDTSDLVIQDMTFTISSNGTAASEDEIALVSLYQNGSLVDSEGDVGTAGDVEFDSFSDIVIAAGDTEEFTVELSFVNTDDTVTGSPYVVALTGMDVEDDDNDEVLITSELTQTDFAGNAALVSGREVSVSDSGSIVTLALDFANEDNEFDKQALAGTEVVIASFDVRADNEEVNVETAEFTISGYTGTGALRDTIVTASLLIDGVAVETNSNSDITNTTITFEDMDNLILPETTSELQLELTLANVGEDYTGENITGLQVTGVTLSDADGVDSGEDVANATSGTVASRTLDIVSALVTPSVADEFGTDDSTAELQLVVGGDSNTTQNGDNVQAELTGLTFNVTSVTTAGTITVLNSNDISVGTASVTTDGTITVAISADSIGNNDETYTIETTAEAIFRLTTDGVQYTINGANDANGNPFTTQLESNLDLGQAADTNN